MTKIKDILLIGKRIMCDKSPVVLSSLPDENWKDIWDAKGGIWTFEDGYLVGKEPDNKGGILLSKKYFEGDVMFSFTAASVLPATLDVNAVYCTTWDEKNNYLKSAYISGIGGWYENKGGIGCFPEDGLRALNPLYQYVPGKEVNITTGAVCGHNFLVVDGVLVQELIDPNPISCGHIGFSPYSTMLKVKNIEVREIVWQECTKKYESEF